ncbi:MAG: hypothetical protein A3G41_07755 [Elusimicrobia bacterium RIFCSPLOWO2_12_FULL_59_9]|nr:MAG: hypothetical protein A3G41_07755 [Elusimicrobia bacterium RIFCSPLOWO2_12_FULL_59_9]
MQVLLTGNRGYIGTVVTEFLSSRGIRVIGLDTDYYRDCDFLDLPEPVQQIYKDSRRIEKADLKGVDAVIHLAALSNDPVGELNEQWTYDINYHASLQLARLAKEVGLPCFLSASSCSLYGISSADEKLTEEAPMAPLTAYAKSKVQCEESIRPLADAKFAAVFMRFATVYGVSPRLRFDLVLNNLVGWAYATGKIRILSDGTPWRPLVHVKDIAQALWCVLEKPPRGGCEVFNVGDNNANYQVKELAACVQKTVPGASIEFTHEHGKDARTFRVDFSRFHRTFPSFRARWDIAKGARELYEVLLQKKLRFEDFDGRRFTRLKQIRYLLNQRRLDEGLFWRH